MAKPGIGFHSALRIGDDEEAINRTFTPEFRNRLDAIVPFAPLGPDTIGRVVDKFVMQLEVQLSDRGVTIALTDAARAWLGRKGYDPAMGARPLSRVIQEHVKKPLADELLFGRLQKGGAVTIDVDAEGRLAFDYPAPAGGGKRENRGGEASRATREPVR
jgi:ATP-dependent Clp protease ATP-binding subunit ClpA